MVIFKKYSNIAQIPQTRVFYFSVKDIVWLGGSQMRPKGPDFCFQLLTNYSIPNGLLGDNFTPPRRDLFSNDLFYYD